MELAHFLHVLQNHFADKKLRKKKIFSYPETSQQENRNIEFLLDIFYLKIIFPLEDY